MTVKFIAITIVLVITLIYNICFGLWALNEKAIRDKSTAKIKGRVIGYAYGSPGKPPKVEYMVNGQHYRKNLQYFSVSIYRTPWHKVEAMTPSDLLATKIKIYQNSMFSMTNFQEKAFPIGSLMTVWYNPKNPKQAYVERYAGYYKIALFSLAILNIPVLIVLSLAFWLVP